MRTVLKLIMRVAVIVFLLALLFVLAADSSAQNVGQGEPVYRVGADVVAPRAVYAPDPEYSEEARIAELQGTCVLSVVVGADGHPRDVKVDRSLGMGLDEKSIEAIRTWRFEPARKDNQAVAVEIDVETSFALDSPGVPEILDPLPPNGTGSQLPDKHAARYPLVVEIAYVTGKQTTSGYVVNAEVTIAGAQPQKVDITCHAKRNCLMLERGKYRARSLRTNEIELTGRSDNKGKLPKAQFSVVPGVESKNPRHRAF